MVIQSVVTRSGSKTTNVQFGYQYIKMDFLPVTEFEGKVPFALGSGFTHNVSLIENPLIFPK